MTLTKIFEIKRNIDYFIGYGCGHNKNLTKKQIEKIENISEIIKNIYDVKNILNEIYLEYVNNYLSIECMAENEKLKIEDMQFLIELGRKINNKEY